MSQPISQQSPLILAFVDDLLFGSKIQAVTEKLDFRLEMIGSMAELVSPDQTHARNEPGEPVHGRDASIFSQIVERQPAMIIFDLHNEKILWRKWMAVLKSSPATRRIPVAAFAPHVDADVRRQAKGHGADLVTTRGKFSEDLPKIIQKFARVADRDALQSACDEPLSELGRKGLELFNAGEYYDCHEELEHAWMEDQGDGRNLYKGVLQVGVAYLQIERGNYNGAVKMLMRVKQWLDPLPAICRGIDIAALRSDASVVYEELRRLGPDRMAELDKSLLKPVRYS